MSSRIFVRLSTNSVRPVDIVNHATGVSLSQPTTTSVYIAAVIRKQEKRSMSWNAQVRLRPLLPSCCPVFNIFVKPIIISHISWNLAESAGACVFLDFPVSLYLSHV